MDGQQLAAVRRHNREHFPCKIKGYKFTRHKGDLCRAHYQIVPHAMKCGAAADAMVAAHRAAKKWHRRQLAYVRKVLAEQPSG